MPKMKTHRGAAKRFKVRASGKIKRRKAGVNHILEKKPPKRKRQLHKPTTVAPADEKNLRRMLGK